MYYIYIYMGEFKNRVPKMRQKYVKKTLFNIEIIPARIVLEVKKKRILH